MRSLRNIVRESLIMESRCSSADYAKHGYKYPLAVISILLGELGDDKKLMLGDKSGDKPVTMDDETRKGLEDLRSEISKSSVKDFDKVVKAAGFKWTDIFKGQLTGYEAGLSANKGNAFEDEFIKDFSEYEPEIKKIVKYDHLEEPPRADGALNQKRPLTFTKDGITCGKISNGDYNIGKTVTDVTLVTDKGEVYLSLKYGSTVTFVNAGVGKILDKSFFQGDEPNAECKMLLDMLCLDADRVRSVFNDYKQPDKKVRSQKDEVDITKELKANDMFKTFVKSVIGYGYILVHKQSDGIHYVDMTTEKALDDMISGLKSATIEYPTGGTAKRVDIKVVYDRIELKFNIRSKQGGVYPTHIMADYKIL